MPRYSLLFLLALPTLRADYSCPRFFDDFGGYCFRVFYPGYPHDQAEGLCSSFGATLATIDNPDLNAAIANVAERFETVWLGYRCNSTTQCIGDDGSVINTTQYFYRGQANPSVGQCVVMATSGALAGKWLSLDCNQQSAYVCGLDLANTYEANMKTSKCGAPYPLNIPVNITSMNYPSNYDDFENCGYFVYGIGEPFTIYFDDFYTQATFDVVSIYSSDHNYGALSLVGQYSGNRGPFNVTVSSRSALITFVTDSDQTYRGFSARIK